MTKGTRQRRIQFWSKGSFL